VCEVRELSICGSLDATDQPALAAIGATRRLEAGETLFYEGDPAKDVFSLTDGMLKLYKLMGDGRRQITGFLVPGDFLGLAFSDTYIYTAEAVVPVAVCRFPRSRFLQLLDGMPDLEKELLARASSELAEAQDQMLLLGRKTARERLASFLLRLADRRRNCEPEAIPLPMSRTDIADYLGLTIETVSRAFTQLRVDGVIALSDAHHFTVPARSELLVRAGE
jgi:CRP/FNR family transcriptional regulator